MGAAQADTGLIEPDSRRVPWDTIRRLALLQGELPSTVQPLSRDELGRYLPMFATSEMEARDRSFSQHSVLGVMGSQRLELGFQDLGRAPAGESGLLLPAGGYLAWQPTLAVAGHGLWAGISVDLSKGLGFGPGAMASTNPLVYGGWPLPAGMAPTGAARTHDGRWEVELARWVLGYRHGNWSATLGKYPSRTGPGIGGALVLDRQAPAFPQIQLRRTSPFRWRGWMRHLAPEQFFFRVGRLSERAFVFENEYGRQESWAHPWYFQWLMSWRPWDFCRLTATQGAMASARDASLWPDLLQINFPVIGTTWRERDSGPTTDRIFALQMEIFWREVPLGFLPSEAGRAYWDYGGTDFLPSGFGGVIPEISIPASVAGVELVSRRWDLNLEYHSTYHYRELWYGNYGYPEGYTQEGAVLGHRIGGGARGGQVKVGLRPGSGRWEGLCRVRHTRWDHDRFLPGDAERTSISLQVGRNPEHHLDGTIWSAEIGWSREDVRPQEGPDANPDVWRVIIRISS